MHHNADAISIMYTVFDSVVAWTRGGIIEKMMLETRPLESCLEESML